MDFQLKDKIALISGSTAYDDQIVPIRSAELFLNWYGLCPTHKDQANADLLAFIKAV